MVVTMALEVTVPTAKRTSNLLQRQSRDQRQITSQYTTKHSKNGNKSPDDEHPQARSLMEARLISLQCHTDEFYSLVNFVTPQP